MKCKVHTFLKGIVEIDTEDNDKLSVLSKVIFDRCPVCSEYAEQDLLYVGEGGMSGLEYACGHEVHSSKHCDIIYKYNGEVL